MISYVIPFTLTLETDSSTAGHVIIKSRGELSEAKNLSVKAVSQSDNVNVKEMTLFYIHVSVSSWPVKHPTAEPRSSTTKTREEPLTPALKHVRLKANAHYSHLVIVPGETMKVNFTLKNLASAETFTFNVSKLRGKKKASLKENGESVVFLPLGKFLFHLQSSFESHNLTTFKKLQAHPDKIFSQQKRPYIKISYQIKLCSSNNRLLFISIRVGFTAHF